MRALVSMLITAALAAAIDRLAGDPALRARLGAAGRARILAEFSIDAMVDGNLAIYRHVLETLRKYHNRAIETAQVIEELIQMAKEFQAVLEREAALGLGQDEIAFYDALANNESAVRELGDDILKKIAIEITEKLRASTTVDWQVRESVRARLRILVRRCLQKWKYPPDQQADAVELVLKQAETLSNSWTH